jgi:hypothetical protein
MTGNEPLTSEDLEITDHDGPTGLGWLRTAESEHIENPAILRKV